MIFSSFKLTQRPCTLGMRASLGLRLSSSISIGRNGTMSDMVLGPSTTHQLLDDDDDDDEEEDELLDHHGGGLSGLSDLSPPAPGSGFSPPAPAFAKAPGPPAFAKAPVIPLIGPSKSASSSPAPSSPHAGSKRRRLRRCSPSSRALRCSQRGKCDTSSISASSPGEPAPPALFQFHHSAVRSTSPKPIPAPPAPIAICIAYAISRSYQSASVWSWFYHRFQSHNQSKRCSSTSSHVSGTSGRPSGRA